MKYEVRDDIIALDTFVRCRFEHHDFLENIYNAGGYALIKQFENNFKNGRYLIDKMIDDGLLKSVTINNHKFVVLTATATKYLRFWDSTKDFSNKAKNTIPAQIFSDKPTQKQLFSSIIKFELILKNSNYSKSEHLALVREQLSELYCSLLGTSESVVHELIESFKAKKQGREKLLDQYTSIYQTFIEVFGDQATQDKICGDYRKSKAALEASNFITRSQKQIEFDVIDAKYQLLLNFSSIMIKRYEEGKALGVEIKELEKELDDKKLKIMRALDYVKAMMAKTEDLIDTSKILVFIEFEKHTGTKKVQLTFEIINYGNAKSVSKYLELLMDYQDMLRHGGVRAPNEQAHLEYRKEKERLRRRGEKLEKAENKARLADTRVCFDNIMFKESLFAIHSYSEAKSMKLVNEFTKRKEERAKAGSKEKQSNYEKDLLEKTPAFTVSYSDCAFYLADVLRNAATHYHSIAKAKDRMAFDEVDSILNTVEMVKKTPLRN